MKLTLLTIIFLLILLVSPIFINSAIGQPPPPPPQDIPIDGGLSLLIVAGMAYGAKKIYSSEKNSQKHDSQ